MVSFYVSVRGMLGSKFISTPSALTHVFNTFHLSLLTCPAPCLQTTHVRPASHLTHHTQSNAFPLLLPFSSLCDHSNLISLGAEEYESTHYLIFSSFLFLFPPCWFRLRTLLASPCISHSAHSSYRHRFIC